MFGYYRYVIAAMGFLLYCQGLFFSLQTTVESTFIRPLCEIVYIVVVMVWRCRVLLNQYTQKCAYIGIQLYKKKHEQKTEKLNS